MKPRGRMPVALSWQALNADIPFRLSGACAPETPLLEKLDCNFDGLVRRIVRVRVYQ